MTFSIGNMSEQFNVIIPFVWTPEYEEHITEHTERQPQSTSTYVMVPPLSLKFAFKVFHYVEGSMRWPNADLKRKKRKIEHFVCRVWDSAILCWASNFLEFLWVFTFASYSCKRTSRIISKNLFKSTTKHSNEKKINNCAAKKQLFNNTHVLQTNWHVNWLVRKERLMSEANIYANQFV